MYDSYIKFRDFILDELKETSQNYLKPFVEIVRKFAYNEGIIRSTYVSYTDIDLNLQEYAEKIMNDLISENLICIQGPTPNGPKPWVYNLYRSIKQR